MRLTIFRRGEERWSFELTRSLSREDEVLVALSASGHAELAECEDPDCEVRISRRQPFGFSR